MNNNTIIELKTPEGNVEDALTQLLRTGARKLIAEAVEAELSELLNHFADLKTEDGRAIESMGSDSIDIAILSRIC